MQPERRGNGREGPSQADIQGKNMPWFLGNARRPVGGGYNETRDEARRGQSSGPSVVLRPLQGGWLSFEGSREASTRLRCDVFHAA